MDAQEVEKAKQFKYSTFTTAANIAQTELLMGIEYKFVAQIWTNPPAVTIWFDQNGGQKQILKETLYVAYREYHEQNKQKGSEALQRSEFFQRMIGLVYLKKSEKRARTGADRYPKIIILPKDKILINFKTIVKVDPEKLDPEDPTYPDDETDDVEPEPQKRLLPKSSSSSTSNQ